MPRTRTRRSAPRTQPYSTDRPTSSRRRSTRSSRLRRDKAHGDAGEGRGFRMTDEDFWAFMYNALEDAKEEAMEVEEKREEKREDATPAEKPRQALTLAEVDLCKDANRKEHHTHEFESPQLVLRRGQPFSLALTFDRDVCSTDMITLQLLTGSRPMESKGSVISLPVVRSGNPPSPAPSVWGVTQAETKGKQLSVVIRIPPNAIVGRYRLSVLTRDVSKKTWQRKLVEEEEMTVLFNPWCPEDDVYVERADWRDEYVMNERGRIWVGSARSFTGRPWYFGQFDDPCLDAALQLLDRAELGESARRNPVSVVRAISAHANSCDDSGVLEGRWSESYPKNCTVPWAWNGSVAILKQFMKSEKPVRFGQCWVFSGITTTLLRALGLATRSVTNFESAHDTDCSMTIDSHWEVDSGDPVPDLDDSVWNFHVWNEAYFKRSDLPLNYDGWQAFDATPQECSEGVMRCGPASLRAIKEGHVYLNHDTGFIFAEVNGDRVHWLVDSSRAMTVLDIFPHSVGRYISTKAVGSHEREDVTHLYKYEEGSPEERRVVETVYRFGTRKHENIYSAKQDQSIKFTFHVPETATMGDDLEVKVTMRNTSDRPLVAKGKLAAMAAFYTGVSGRRLAALDFKVDVPPQQEVEAKLAVKEDDYLGKLGGEATLLLQTSFHVEATRQFFVSKKNLILNKPRLTLKVPAQVKVGEQQVGYVSFHNPLNISLSNAAILVEGGGVRDLEPFHVGKPLKSEETTTDFKFTINPRLPGQKEVVATFTSDQLTGVDGSAEYEAVLA